MKRILTTLIATTLLAGSAYAQSIQIGPGGVEVDPRSPRDRAIERDIRREERDRDRDRYERRRDRRAEDCRVITTREETPRGVVRRETRVCD